MLALPGCVEELRVDGIFSVQEWSTIEQLSPMPDVAPDPTNAVADDDAAATLGQRLFFETRFSGPLAVGDDGTNGGLGTVGESGTVSCASCHMPGAWFNDARSNPNATSLAADWTSRNTPTAVNSAYVTFQFWDGRADSLWSQALGPTEAGPEMNGTRLRVAHVLYEHYRAEYDAVFEPDLDPALDPAHPDASRFPAEGRPGDAAWDGMAPADQQIVNQVFANYGKAIAAYERRLISRDAPFDRYVAGETGAISMAAKRGLQLFVGKAGCVECHSGPLLTDQEFHNIGVAQIGEHVPASDDGRIAGIEALLTDPFNAAGEFSDDRSAPHLDGLAPDESLRGAFRTSSLRQISETGPYMHTGHLSALAEVVELYNRGGDPSGFAGTVDPVIVPLNLSASEVGDLVAFLETLTGAEPSAALMEDTSAP